MSQLIWIQEYISKWVDLPPDWPNSFCHHSQDVSIHIFNTCNTIAIECKSTGHDTKLQDEICAARNWGFLWARESNVVKLLKRCKERSGWTIAEALHCPELQSWSFVWRWPRDWRQTKVSWGRLQLTGDTNEDIVSCLPTVTKYANDL